MRESGMWSILFFSLGSTIQRSRFYSTSSKRQLGEILLSATLTFIDKFYSRLKEHKDTAALMVFSLDLITHRHPIISFVPSLPYDTVSILACPASLGGVVVLISNGIIYIDQTGRKVGVAVNGWATRTTDLSMPLAGKDIDMKLEGAKLAFLDNRHLLLMLSNGEMRELEFIVDGKTVSKLVFGKKEIGRGTIPSLAENVGDKMVFVGSMVGPSILVKIGRVADEEPSKVKEETTLPGGLDLMDLDDDEGESSTCSFIHDVTSLILPYRYLQGRRTPTPAHGKWSLGQGFQ